MPGTAAQQMFQQEVLTLKFLGGQDKPFGLDRTDQMMRDICEAVCLLVPLRVGRR